MFDQIRMKLQNFNINTFLASVVATAASITSDDYYSFCYFVIALIAQGITILSAYHKLQRDRELQDVEVELKKEELRTKRIANDKISKNNE